VTLRPRLRRLAAPTMGWRRLPVRLWWARADRQPMLAPLAAAGLLAAGMLAVVGLPPVDLHGPLQRLGSWTCCAA
jgi:hypothetical protein